ncbi:MAG: hypothetical protein KC618_07050 [Candidatus Omnitrophica bacterium]|nr:hypothetical protein [Candidatus Omnitrophota bacterium]
MKKLIAIFISIIFCSGCSKLAHLDEMLRLKKIGDGVEDADAYVEKADRRFAELVQLYKEGKLVQYSTTTGQILKKFGQPIQVKTVQHDEEEAERWLYRKAVEYFNTEKIYLYFSAEGKMIDVEYEPAPTKQESSE